MVCPPPCQPPSHSQMQELCFFASAIFDNIGRTHPPAICSCYGANYCRMSRQFLDNRQCCRETIVSAPALSLSFLFFFIISADDGTFRSASSMAPSSELKPIILCPGPVEIQFHHQSVEPAINKDGSSPLDSVFSWPSIMRL